ncbi:hypothetical protein U9M48_018679 [Paspalum notatum var. saurae]|uniref:Uncharacterized protein n=1 Tax=Paspalum notatum var. saurae TaxID=547442 RepID=A0AAQ3TDD7_PASNO
MERKMILWNIIHRFLQVEWEIYLFGDSHKKKYRLARWEILCLRKEQRGLSIRNLEIQNICFLSKWLYKLINEEEHTKKKYLKGKSIGEVQWKTVAAMFSSTPLNISFRRALVGDRFRKWEELVSKIAMVQLDDLIVLNGTSPNMVVSQLTQCINIW